MKRLTITLIALVALALAPTVVPAEVQGPVTLTAALEEARSAPNDPILVSLTLANRGAKTAKPLLQEYDAQGKSLPYPAGLTVRIVDPAGRVVTENDMSKDEWWSAYYTWPRVTLVRKESKSRYSLKAGKEVKRIIDLRKVVTGLEAFAAGIPEGTYKVQFDLSGLRSNEIAITVGQ